MASAPGGDLGQSRLPCPAETQSRWTLAFGALPGGGVRDALLGAANAATLACANGALGPSSLPLGSSASAGRLLLGTGSCPHVLLSSCTLGGSSVLPLCPPGPSPCIIPGALGPRNLLAPRRCERPSSSISISTAGLPLAAPASPCVLRAFPRKPTATRTCPRALRNRRLGGHPGSAACPSSGGAGSCSSAPAPSPGYGTTIPAGGTAPSAFAALPLTPPGPASRLDHHRTPNRALCSGHNPPRRRMASLRPWHPSCPSSCQNAWHATHHASPSPPSPQLLHRLSSTQLSSCPQTAPQASQNHGSAGWGSGTSHEHLLCQFLAATGGTARPSGPIAVSPFLLIACCTCWRFAPFTPATLMVPLRTSLGWVGAASSCSACAPRAATTGHTICASALVTASRRSGL